MSGFTLLALGALTLLLTPIVATDLRERRIPNLANLALGFTGLALQLVQAPSWRTLGRSALAAALCALLFLGLLWVMARLKRRSGLGLGLGDVKFLIAASQWVGALGSAWVFVAASLIALVVALAIAPWRGLDLQRQIPFAPALAGALLAVYALPFFLR